MRKLAVFVTTLLIILTTLIAQSQTEATPELQQAMQERLEAVWKKDAETWASLTADEFTLVIPEGTLMDKKERLAALKSEKPEPSHAVRNEHVHMYEDTAVHRFVDGSEWILEVWHRDNGKWRVVAAQVNFVKP
jgi:outer membrane lipoprotein-sorting protein